jgi:hypothetical protein
MSTILDPAPPRPRWTHLIGVPVAAVSLAGLVACGSGATSSTTSSSTGSGAQASTSDTAMATYSSCLAKNGVTLPQRGTDGGGAAGGGANGGSPPTGTPPAGGPGGSGGQGGSGQASGAMAAPPGVDATKWTAAQKACAQYAPTPPSGAATAQ